ncbi:hypothetical protein MAN_06424, partial [Metarhizium hybridum]
MPPHKSPSLGFSLNLPPFTPNRHPAQANPPTTPPAPTAPIIPRPPKPFRLPAAQAAATPDRLPRGRDAQPGERSRRQRAREHVRREDDVRHRLVLCVRRVREVARHYSRICGCE